MYAMRNRGPHRENVENILGNLPGHRDNATHRGISISQPCYKEKCMEWKYHPVLFNVHTRSKSTRSKCKRFRFLAIASYLSELVGDMSVLDPTGVPVTGGPPI